MFKQESIYFKSIEIKICNPVDNEYLMKKYSIKDENVADAITSIFNPIKSDIIEIIPMNGEYDLQKVLDYIKDNFVDEYFQSVLKDLYSVDYALKFSQKNNYYKNLDLIHTSLDSIISHLIKKIKWENADEITTKLIYKYVLGYFK